MTPNHEDRAPVIFPDGYHWDPEDRDPCDGIIEWFTLEGCESLDGGEYGLVVSAVLGGIEYHIGPSTDPTLGESEVISTLVMGSPMPVDLLEDLVTARLPRPLPNDLGIEMGELGENDAHCWLVRRFTWEQLDDDAVFAALMEEFTAITRDFVETWAAA